MSDTRRQPPLGGCVLKQMFRSFQRCDVSPAAFRRLCVETAHAETSSTSAAQPPLGGCVLKLGEVRQAEQYLQTSRL